jgi:hypothetical protein
MTQPTDDQAQSPEIGQYAADMRAVLASAGLTDDETRYLALVLYDKATQRGIAKELARPRQTIGYKIASAVAKLKKIGVHVKLPGRGRTKSVGEIVRLDPAVMTRLTTQSVGGVTMAKWTDSKEPEDDER